MLTVDLARVRMQPGDRLLDLGCGGGRHAFAAARAGAHVVALDAAADECAAVAGMLAAMRDTGEIDEKLPAGVVRGSALALPFADRSFERVIAAEVLEHLQRDDLAALELARVLVPGGLLAVSVPRFVPELVNWALSGEYHRVEGGHVRIYRRRQLRRRLAVAGFRELSAHHAHALHTPYWWLRCLVGVRRDEQWLVAAYHRFLVWDIMKRPVITRVAERVLRPVLGKSLVVYFERT